MFRFTSTKILTAALALILCAAPALATDPTVVTFDCGQAGFEIPASCTSMEIDGDNNYLYFSSVCDDVANLNGWFNIYNTTDAAFIGDYTANGETRISVDLDVEFYDFLNWGSWIEAEEYRELVIELVDYDNPAPGYPYTSVWFNAGPLQNRADGWKTFTVDVVDVYSEELPEGWGGYGAEDPDTYEPTLPDHRTYSDVLASVDEIRITTLVPGMFYSYNFVHGINIDNISVGEIVVEVPFDFIPGDCPNGFDVVAGDDEGSDDEGSDEQEPCGDYGDPSGAPVVYAAIMGTEDLDVQSIDPSSIRLDGIAPVGSSYRDVGSYFEPFTGKQSCELDCNDFYPDGWTDLQLTFDAWEVNELMKDAAHGECFVLNLTGRVWDHLGGNPIVGEDLVVISNGGLGGYDGWTPERDTDDRFGRHLTDDDSPSVEFGSN
jgi:hypothetical protein